uniref:Uncharacterized protein n=1 Tax=Plectus sambesii TaxID=2011161 RepID=A0A914V7I6_9BILA
MGATNRPYELDEAVIRRFPKRIMIDLPDARARLELIQSLLAQQKHSLSAHDLRSLADRTDSYSSADLVSLAKEAAMAPIREVRKERLVDLSVCEIRPLCLSDFEAALNAVKPSTSDKAMDKLKEFAKRCGQLA